eukprot:1094954-Prorocentrum_minimum.AAC.3
MSKEIRPVVKKFMTDPMEIYVDDEAKLTLHGLVQHYVKLQEREKNRKLNDLLDALDFNQVNFRQARRAAAGWGRRHWHESCCAAVAAAGRRRGFGCDGWGGRRGEGRLGRHWYCRWLPLVATGVAAGCLGRRAEWGGYTTGRGDAR